MISVGVGVIGAVVALVLDVDCGVGVDGVGVVVALAVHSVYSRQCLPNTGYSSQESGLQTLHRSKNGKEQAKLMILIDFLHSH